MWLLNGHKLEQNISMQSGSRCILVIGAYCSEG